MNPALDRDRTQFGKYTLVERLGRGGMADVWKAKISGPGGFQRTLVIKRILPHLVEDEQFKQMFVAEARLSARLNHANIVQVFELGDVDGEFYLAMEYVRGRDLVNVVRAQLLKGLPPPGMGAFVARELCRALAYAHALTDDNGTPLRLIHRDVSPSNVMISFDGAVKLLDFGIAKALAEANENRTVTGTLKGKFGYMSPEQVEGKEVDNRADLFAAGVVLHEILTGKRLFKGASDLQTIAMVRDAKVDPPSLHNPAVPRELDDICLKALARLPDNH
jgi:eukaryotic-like serine/threonine-protein kinase